MKTFNGLSVSSKFAICGLPIRLDSYRTCSFGCRYCFSNCRVVSAHRGGLEVADVGRIERILDRIAKHGPKDGVLLDRLIANGITWHFGGMSDPFQPINQQLRITNDIIDATSSHGVHLLISTKTDSLHDANVRPDMHAFQLSVSNTYDRKDIEPNVPSIDRRIRLYRDLKRDGFKVGIRIQPFIPGITTTDILDAFPDADHYTIECLKLVVHNREQRELMNRITGLHDSDWRRTCMMSLDPSVRLKQYEPFISEMKRRGYSYSIADNDLRLYSTDRCCCGDALVSQSSGIDTTAMLREHADGYAVDDVLRACDALGISRCNCRRYVMDNSASCPDTVAAYIESRFRNPKSPCSHLFQYAPGTEYTFDRAELIERLRSNVLASRPPTFGMNEEEARYVREVILYPFQR